MTEVERNPFHVATILNVAVKFPDHEQTMRNHLRAANFRSLHAIPGEVHKEEHIEERLVFAVGNDDQDWKKVSDEVTFSTTKEGPTFEYRTPVTRFDHIYSAICARSGRVSVLCWGGFFAGEWAQSIAFAGNSTSRNINGCWNAIWFFMLGYYNLMESFNFSRIMIVPTRLN